MSNSQQQDNSDTEEWQEEPPDLSDRFEDWLCGEKRWLWPDWRCTTNNSVATRPVRRRLPKGKKVEPLKEYSFHTPFDVRTDGYQWILRGESKSGDYRANVGVLLFFAIGLTVSGLIAYPEEALGLWLLIPATLLWPAFIYNLYKARTTGEDTWIVLDRTTGNVCFWRKDAAHSLTVPFDQVHCYWVHAYHRGGHSHHLHLMPEVSLPNERGRWWPVMMGFANSYEQAQYFWRVLTDFMDPDGHIPEVDGLIHQVRACEKLGYGIEDITEHGRTIPDEVWQEVEEEITEEVRALDQELDRIMAPEEFSSARMIEFYRQSPEYFKKSMVTKVGGRLNIWLRLLKEDNCMAPGFWKHFSMPEYRAQVQQLRDFFTPLSILPIDPL